MKRLIIIGLFLLLPMLSRAQSRALEALFDRYGAAEGFTTVAFEQKMMHMMSIQAAQRGDEELARLLDEIVFIRVLTTTDQIGLAVHAERIVKANKHFERLTSTSTDGQTTQVYLGETKLSPNKELVVITRSKEETAVVHIFGSFDVHEVGRIANIRPR